MAGRKKNAIPEEEDKTTELPEENIVTDEENAQPVYNPPPPEKQAPQKMGGLISSKIFVNQLKKELKDKSISEAVYIAFIAVTKRVDTEVNYRKIWKTTFKRD